MSMKYDDIERAAFKRVRDIITAINKADDKELEALCLSSLYGDVKDLYDDAEDMKSKFDSPQYWEIIHIFNKCDNCLQYNNNMLHSFNANWLDVKEHVKDMLKCWFREEPACIITNLAFKMYKIFIEHIGNDTYYINVIMPLAEYLSENDCDIPDVTVAYDVDFVDEVFKNIICGGEE